MSDVYLDGDPETESTRRQMERLLRGERRRRWPWLFGAVAGGTAFVFWRARRRAREANRPSIAARLGVTPRTRV
jgi:hypothetical protein